MKGVSSLISVRMTVMLAIVDCEESSVAFTVNTYLSIFSRSSTPDSSTLRSSEFVPKPKMSPISRVPVLVRAVPTATEN